MLSVMAHALLVLAKIALYACLFSIILLVFFLCMSVPPPVPLLLLQVERLRAENQMRENMLAENLRRQQASIARNVQR